jgi:hypothetical protein
MPRKPKRVKKLEKLRKSEGANEMKQEQPVKT